MKLGAKHHGLEQTLRVAREWYEDAPCTDRWRKSTSRWTQQATSDHSSVALQMFQQCFWCSNSTLATCPYCWQVDILSLWKKTALKIHVWFQSYRPTSTEDKVPVQGEVWNLIISSSPSSGFRGFFWWLFVNLSNPCWRQQPQSWGQRCRCIHEHKFHYTSNTDEYMDEVWLYRIVTIIILLFNYQRLSYTWSKADC